MLASQAIKLALSCFSLSIRQVIITGPVSCSLNGVVTQESETWEKINSVEMQHRLLKLRVIQETDLPATSQLGRSICSSDPIAEDSCSGVLYHRCIYL